MNVQVNTVKSGDKVYKYCQLVKAFRSDDRKPRGQVVSNLSVDEDGLTTESR